MMVSNGKCGNVWRDPEEVATYMYLFLFSENSGLITGKSIDLFHLLIKGSAPHFWQLPSASN